MATVAAAFVATLDRGASVGCVCADSVPKISLCMTQRARLNPRLPWTGSRMLMRRSALAVSPTAHSQSHRGLHASVTPAFATLRCSTGQASVGLSFQSRRKGTNAVGRRQARLTLIVWMESVEIVAAHGVLVWLNVLQVVALTSSLLNHNGARAMEREHLLGPASSKNAKVHLLCFDLASRLRVWRATP